jgi:hypothetical protein
MPTIDELHRDMNGVERAIIMKLLDDALEAGCLISVDDGVEMVIEQSADKAAIFAEMFSTGEDTLYFYKDGDKRGWVWLIYGNDYAIISDYCDNSFTNGLLAPAMALADTFE